MTAGGALLSAGSDGATVTAVGSARECLAQDLQSYDIILLDYKLPGMSGLDVMARLEADKQDVLVIMITAYASIETAVAAIAAVKRVPGRLDQVSNPRDILAFVDYAHTPDALKNVLLHAKELAKSRLIVVFGCGGDRDQLKRPLMGEAVGRIADTAVVTSDNPRTEDPGSIIEMIIPGLDKAGGTYEVIEDRRAAIQRAVAIACPGDVIIVAGKGHEDYQIIGTEKKHFDDREVLEEFLK